MKPKNIKKKNLFRRKKIGFRRRKWGRGNLQVKPYTKGNKVYLGRKIKRGHGIISTVLKGFAEPLFWVFEKNETKK